MIDNTFSTIISLLPFDLCEVKPGLNPNEFTINAMEDDKIGLTIIPNNVFYLINADPLADEKNVRNVKVPIPSIELAQSIINDYISSLLGVSVPDAVPGLIAVSGNHIDKKETATRFLKEIVTFRSYQNNWFKNLVDIADDSWAKTHSPLGISDLQRSGAKSLGLKRDWINPIASELANICPICKSVINVGSLKCTVCNTVLNKIEYDKVLAGIK